MLKKSVLNKLSDKELEKYIAPNSRFTSDAVKLALEILIERNHTFSETETKRINALIDNKKENEKREELEEPNLVYLNHADAKELFTKVFIINFSVLISFILGAYYLSRNIKILNQVNKQSIITLIIFAGISIFIDVFSFTLLYEHKDEITELIRRNTIITRLSEEYFYLVIFFSIRFIYSKIFIHYYWDVYIGKDLKYKKNTDLI